LISTSSRVTATSADPTAARQGAATTGGIAVTAAACYGDLDRSELRRPATKGNPMRGTMLWFNEVDDFGFISSEDGTRVRVRGSSFVDGGRPEGRCAGRAVTFRLSADGNGDAPSAEEVVLVSEVAPRRARLRHRGRAG
jgi:cold shock CspA family protein